MIRWFFASLLLLATLFAAPAYAQSPDLAKMSNDELMEHAPEHPSIAYVLSARLLAQGKGLEAAKWMYAGQLRYRYLIATTKDTAKPGEHALFGALTEQVGRPVNEYIGGDVDEWIEAIDWALQWDEQTPDPLVDREQHSADIKEIRDGLIKLRNDIDGRREEIAKGRAENGLPNR